MLNRRDFNKVAGLLPLGLLANNVWGIAPKNELKEIDHFKWIYVSDEHIKHTWNNNVCVDFTNGEDTVSVPLYSPTNSLEHDAKNTLEWAYKDFSGNGEGWSLSFDEYVESISRTRVAIRYKGKQGLLYGFMCSNEWMLQLKNKYSINDINDPQTIEDIIKLAINRNIMVYDADAKPNELTTRLKILINVVMGHNGGKRPTHLLVNDGVHTLIEISNFEDYDGFVVGKRTLVQTPIDIDLTELHEICGGSYPNGDSKIALALDLSKGLNLSDNTTYLLASY